jgi:hypothetical protein
LPADVTAALATQYASPLIFRTEVRPNLYLASAGLFVLGAMFVGYFLWGPEGQGFVGVLIAAVGVFMLYIAWVNLLTTRAGYPHLILVGHRLTVQSSDAFRRDIDLSKMGETEVVVVTAPKSSRNLYLCFKPAAGATLKPSRFTAPKLQPFAEAVLLNGYIGGDLKGAEDIERVIKVRREQPKVDIPLPREDVGKRSAARMRLVATAGVFAVLWVALVWWKLLP